MNKFVHFLVPLLASLFIIGCIGWYLFVYDRDFTRDSLLEQARYQDLHGNARISSMLYDLAYEFSDGEESVAIELANQYKADGNYTKAEYTLTNAINDGATVDLYIALCKTFVEQDKLLDAVAMLTNIGDAEIKATLDAMRPTAPVASHKAGFYSQYIQVSLSSNAPTMYYSTDGEYPSTANAAYNGAISLPAGETVIQAIAVAENGLVSPVTVISYTVTGVIEDAIFTDPTMEAAVRAAAGVDADDELLTDALWAISEFTVPQGVGSHEDLKLLPYLTKLTIQDQTIGTLDCLSAMTNLQELNLSGSRFPSEDLTVLAALPQLKRLTLSDCGLSTLAGLIGSPALTYLDLSNNTIRNLEPLQDMNTLIEINLQHNALTDLTALSKLTELQALDVSYNALTTLAPIRSCIKLGYLAADNNALTTLEGMNSLPLLSTLSVDYNKLSDISILQYCTELTSLSFANNAVSDISMLGGLLKLDILDFSYNTVTNLPAWQEGCALRIIDGSYNSLGSIDSLKNLANIAYIYMDYNALTNVNAIAECYHLVQVNVYGNAIADVSALTEHNIIVNYDPTV